MPPQRPTEHKVMDSVYRPTSLDFINWPNPVEPQSVPHHHPLNNSQSRPTVNSSTALLPSLDQQTSSERSNKRRISGEVKTLDLPKLPVRQQGHRFRIPPTLTGLHQPPPDAGLLPKISVDQPVSQQRHPPIGRVGDVRPTVDASEPSFATSVSPSSSKPATIPTSTTPIRAKPKRKRWTDQETADLLKGVARFGMGKWTMILKCSDYHFQDRTAIDLKDRFRVCCPNEYLGDTAPLIRKSTTVGPGGDQSLSKLDRKSTSELRELGINGPFVPTSRRKRHGYSQAEDEALLKGFERHGNSWAAIKYDADLGLEHRKPTDLRDRFRTRYPEKYAKAGLAPRPNDHGKQSRRITSTQASTKDQEPQPNLADSETSIHKSSKLDDLGRKASRGSTGLKQSQPHSSSLFAYDDVFFGAPDEQYDGHEEIERITLDRGILDWPSDFQRPPARVPPDVLPKLSRPPAFHDANAKPPPLVRPSNQNLSNAILPSFATIASRSTDIEDGEQLELPSLVGFGSLENSGRGGGQFLGLDELLS